AAGCGFLGGLLAIGGDEDRTRFRADDARIGGLAADKLLAQDAPRDGHGLPSLRRVLLDQAAAAEFLVVGGEADIDRADGELAVDLLEDLLRVEIAPDVRAVKVRRVGVLAADDDVAEAVVL